MEALNQSLFLWINAAPGAPVWALWLAHGCAAYLLWLVPAALLVGWETLFDATRFAQRLRVSVWLKGPG